MKMLKNKKRLSGVVIAFLLTFLIGAAFAATPGVLTITGPVTLAPQNLYVQWEDPISLNPLFGGIATGNVTQSSSVLPGTDAAGRTRQTIEWIVRFTGEGQASIIAGVENVGDLDAIVTVDEYVWGGASAATITALGLVVTLDDFGMFDPYMLAAGTSSLLPFEATIDFPGFDGLTDAQMDEIFPDGQELVLSLTITLDYVAAP